MSLLVWVSVHGRADFANLAEFCLAMSDGVEQKKRNYSRLSGRVQVAELPAAMGIMAP
jgi:hypothetical protein